MCRQFTVALGLVGVFVATSAHALGLGAIRVDSGLNQPFAAEIPLRSVSADELETVRVRLADTDEFRRLGIERADYLSDLRFELLPGASPVIRISSARPARDPFLTFLLDVRTDSQRVLREYTVLLDPPPEAVSRGTVTARAPEPGPTLEAFPPPRSEPQPTRPPAPVATPRPAISLTSTPEPEPTSTPTPQLTEAPAADTNAGNDPESGSRYGPIQPQETLWSIANKLRPDSASVNQTLLALYTANPSAFDRGRFDGLLRGVTLTVPPASVITQVDPVTARDRVIALRAGTTSTASAQETVRATPRPTPRATPVATPRPTPTPTPSPTPVAALSPSTTEVDPLVDSSDPGAELDDSAPVAGDGAVGGTDPSLGEASLAGDETLFEEDQGVDALEESGEISEDRAASVDAGGEAPATLPTPVAPVDNEGGLLEALLLPLLLVLAAALIGGGWWWSRRAGRAGAPQAASRQPALSAKTPAPAAAAAASAPPSPSSPSAAELADEAEAAVMAAFAGGRNEAAVTPVDEALDPQPDFLSGTSELGSGSGSGSETDADRADDLESTQIFSSPLSGEHKAIPDTPDFTGTGQFQVDAVKVDLDNQDPAAEADIHMAYGLYDEAELSLNKALEASPDRPEWLFKLAEVHFAAGRGLQFVEAAERAKPHLSAADWQKLALLGRQISPENPLFADADDDAAMAAEVDLSFDEPAPVAGGDDAASPHVADTMTPIIEDPMAASAGTPPAKDLSEFSLDTPALDVDAAIDPNSLEFDLDDFQVDEAAGPDTPPAASEPPADERDSDAEADRGESLDFDLELNPVVPSSAALPATEPVSAPEGDSANRLEFSLDDFDTPAAEDAPSSSEPPAPESRGDAIDFQLDSFDLDDSDTISSGDEAATKLDLARAYVDMGDKEMAQALLNEVLAEGSAQQQDEARALIARMA